MPVRRSDVKNLRMCQLGESATGEGRDATPCRNLAAMPVVFGPRKVHACTAHAGMLKEARELMIQRALQEAHVRQNAVHEADALTGIDPERLGEYQTETEPGVQRER